MEKELNKVFYLLPGEKMLKKALLLNCYVGLTNYRLYFISTGSNPGNNLNNDSKPYHIGLPLNLILKIEQLEFKCLRFTIKLGNSYTLFFENIEMCNDWFKEVTEISLNAKPDELFAYTYFETLKIRLGSNSVISTMLKLNKELEDIVIWEKEFRRMGFDENKWKITSVNKDFKVCDSYPRFHIVPRSIDNDDIMRMSHFRGNKRFPSVVWRSQQNGAVIIRCAQPQVGLMCWRNQSDEQFVDEVQKCTKLESDIKNKINRKLVIIDARHYTTAHFNRIRGGGTEFSEYYGDADIMFMQLENIHSVRSSFDYVSMFSMNAENWLSSFEASYWLRYVSKLLRSAGDIARILHDESRSVIIHCSDGWDRTPQLTSLTQLLLDDYYRTIEGFQLLVEKEWIQFGHKFMDRCCIGRSFDSRERSPVFVQWLDCVHQLLKQHPTQFEFNETFLIKLAIHVYSGLFGEFLCNTEEERIRTNCRNSTISVWSFLGSKNNENFINPLYFKNIPFSTTVGSIGNGNSTILSANYHTKYLAPWYKLLFESLNSAECQKNFSLDFVARNQNLASFKNGSIEDVHEELGANASIIDSKDDDLLMAANLNYNKLSGVRRSKSASNLTIIPNSSGLNYCDGYIQKYERSDNIGIGSRPNILLASNSKISCSPSASKAEASFKMDGTGDLKYAGSCRLVSSTLHSESSQFINHQPSPVQHQQLSPVHSLNVTTDNKSVSLRSDGVHSAIYSCPTTSTNINGYSQSVSDTEATSSLYGNKHGIVNNNCNTHGLGIDLNRSPFNYQTTELYAVSTPSSVDLLTQTYENNTTFGNDMLRGSEDDLSITNSSSVELNFSTYYFHMHFFEDSLDEPRITSSSLSYHSCPSSRNTSGATNGSGSNGDNSGFTNATTQIYYPCDVDGIFINMEPMNMLAAYWRDTFLKQKLKISALETQNAAFFVNSGTHFRDNSEPVALRYKLNRANKPIVQLRANSGSSLARIRNEDSVSSHDSYVMLENGLMDTFNIVNRPHTNVSWPERRRDLQNMPDGLSLENLPTCTKECSNIVTANYISPKPSSAASVATTTSTNSTPAPSSSNSHEKTSP